MARTKKGKLIAWPLVRVGWLPQRKDKNRRRRRPCKVLEFRPAEASARQSG